MDLTYREKRIWINLIASTIPYAAYFFELHHGRITAMGLVGVVIAIVLLQIVLQSILALTSRSEAKDERDIAIERAGYRAGYGVLVAALFAWLVFLTTFAFRPGSEHAFHFSVFQVINYILFALLLGEIGKLLSQLVLYRREA